MSDRNESYAERIRRQRQRLFEITAKDETGRKAWYFIVVPVHKVSAFEVALKKGSLNLDDWGEIVESAYGDEPPAELRTRLHKEYGPP